MEITREQLAQIIPKNSYIDQWCSALNKLLPDYGIDTPQRVASF
jgi:predicted chitinase